MKILIAGVSGLLGVRLYRNLDNSGYDVTGYSRNFIENRSVKLAKKLSISETLELVRPSLVINLIGATSVENCEQDLNAAYIANAKTVNEIATFIKNQLPRCRLLHLSTDHVYDGSSESKEDDVVLRNNYAITKLLGEHYAKLVPSTILRTNFVGRSFTQGRVSMTDWVYYSLSSKMETKVLSDVLFSPLSIESLINYIKNVIEVMPQGTFNLGSTNGMSKADFDFKFAKHLNLPVDTMTKITSGEAKFLKAKRPLDMRMDCSLFEKIMKISLPTLDSEIIEACKDYEVQNVF